MASSKAQEMLNLSAELAGEYLNSDSILNLSKEDIIKLFHYYLHQQIFHDSKVSISNSLSFLQKSKWDKLLKVSANDAFEFASQIIDPSIGIKSIANSEFDNFNKFLVENVKGFKPTFKATIDNK